ncbi:MAG: prepilin-type N-terminal cleavage/methylation domain-containing protein [Chloroflexota bacterium]
MKRQIRKQKGFTLVEILIVIAIIGILAAVIIPRMGGFFSQGEEAAFNGEKKTLQSAVDAYFANSAVERQDLDGEPQGPGLYPTYSSEGGDFPEEVDSTTEEPEGSIINIDFLMSAGDDYDEGYIKEGYISEYPKSACELNGDDIENGGHYCWYVDGGGKVQARYYDADEGEWLDGYQDVYP